MAAPSPSPSPPPPNDPFIFGSSSSSSNQGAKLIPKRKRHHQQIDQEQKIMDVVEVNDDDDDDDVVVLKKTTSDKGVVKGTNKSNAISVERYSENRDLQLAIMLSLLKSPPNSQSFINLDDHLDDDGDDDDDELRVLMFKPKIQNWRRTTSTSTSGPLLETGQSSSSKPNNQNSSFEFLCEICAEPKSGNESFSIKGCDHAYCTECMAMYVASKLQDNITAIRCPVPECVEGLLEPEQCRSILPKDVFDRWGNALCEAVIPASQKFYCPFKDCSALLLDDTSESGDSIRESHCPYCYRMFCAQCKVPWHSDIDCDQFQKLHQNEREREDIMLLNLAQNKSWSRCPSCRFYVDKNQGCMFIKCRCGIEFCYRCGTATTRSHFCAKCKC
ncbi:E3 ubiquitin-protein ligase HEL1 [Castanea sativa]|uniref:E3 ubiquitin-protein ligase HEL1 n=1 Tax=Castanea sativa TaxID=21020 RepID=UPI003F64A3D9